MARYFIHGRTRVWIVDDIADPSAPTVAEINAGTDVTADVWKATVAASTATLNRSRWRTDHEVDEPVRYGYGIDLGGYRHTVSNEEVLWSLCAEFRGTTHLVIRRGLLTTTPVAAGHVVEVYRGRWGRRTNAGDAAAMFEVPFYPNLSNDEVEVA